MLNLLIRTPEGKVRRERMTGDELSIGRSQSNDILISDPSVSRCHARLRDIGDAFEISDENSRNGVFVNERRISSATRLAPGDRIRLGDVTLDLVSESDEVNIRLSDDRFEMSPDSTAILPYVATPRRLVDSLVDDTDSSRPRLGEQGKLLAFFEQITQSVIERRPLDDVLDEIVSHTLEIIEEADRACLILIEDGVFEPRVARNRQGPLDQMTVSNSVARHVADRRESLLSFNAQEDRRFSATESVAVLGICSVMCVPLVGDETIVGVLYVDTLSPAKRFSPGELKLFASVGNLAAGHLERQRLLDESVRRQVFEQQLHAARDTWKRLLPTASVEVPGHKVHMSSRPCLAVGGDYVDLLPGREGSWLVALGDVSGKGMDAALLMATLVSAVRAQSETDRDVLEIVRQINRFLVEHTAADKFATLFLAALDPESGRLSYVNAGHLHPVLLPAGSEEVTRLESTGLVVGALADAPMESATVTLAGGDLLYVFTDGLTEPASADDEEFGEDRLIDCLRDHRDLPLADLGAAIEATVLAFSAPGEQHDDMTQLLLLRG